LYRTVWTFGHVKLVKESSSGTETWLITQNLKPKNLAKKMEALSSVKMTVENCLGTINICLLWISLTMVKLCAECYRGTLSLQQPFFCKRP